MPEQTEQTEAREQENGASEGDGGGNKAVRAAAIAAATGATAFAAKKAFSGRSQSEAGAKGDSRSRKSSGGEDSLIGDMVSSGWHAAKDSLLPFAEEAAGAAGEWVARSGPDVLADTLVPRFIRGFERARKKSSGDAEG
jgi:hypothetical protein